ncbi:hypothetical protein CBR_g40132 [Chara braunii]|uniref:DUF659 domain-containing protein n=1 Tax=Chara braunii TaxID=69332 RepID=A0A388LTC9_CHABU|nr:hypothetical protein CBR_g40132 [Chara braunii]|eukprot:GBG85493.1 hypothetical protein CBR_g40132 [Chara braunii]
MASFVVDELQKEFDQAIASFFFENAIAFNAARSDSYKNMERIMNEAARSRKMLKLPRYNFLRTKALPTEYKTVDTDLDTIREPWDVTGLTLMTDGTTTTSNRPVINFIAVGDSGAVMVKSVDMEGQDKSAPALARMWEEVIRELGVHRVNAICTDSAQVNIFARKILAEHEDPTIRSIPWVPCACHVCNLLMSDIATVPWIAEVILQGREITTFIKRHQRALAMFRRAGREYKAQLGIIDAAWMLHPLHKSPRLFDDLESEEIMNTLAHFASVYTKDSKEYKECWRSLESFHHKTPEWIRPNAEEALACTHVSHAQWWLTYGKNHKSLQKIAVAVLSMWTTASPCERNWSTFDLIHTKRRNLLSPENLQMLVFIHWNKKLLKMSKMKTGFVNTERLEWETPEDVAPYDGFMKDGEYDPDEVKRRAANWSKSRGRRSKSTKFDIRELEEEREDDGAWLLDLSYRPRRLADHDRGKTVVDVDDEEPDHDSEDDGELVRVELVDRRSTRRSGDGSSSSSPHDHITMPEEGIRSRHQTSTSGGATSVQGTASLSGAQLTRHRPPTLEEAGTARGTTPGGSLHVPHDSDALEADAFVDADMDGPIAVAPMEADAVADARGDDPVGEHGDDPAGATAPDGVVGAVDGGAVGADTGTDDGPIASGDGFFTPDPGLRLGESFASLLPHVAPIAPRGSAQDFCKHLASMSPMRTDDESYTPDWARFTGPTPPTLRLDEDIRLVAGEGTHAQVYVQRTTPVPDGGTIPPHDMNARRATGSPPEIDESKVRRVKSLAGRKKGGKNKGKEAAAPKTRGGRRNGRKTVTPPETLEEKSAVVRQAKRKKAQRVQQKAAAASRSPKRGPQKKRKRVQEDDKSSSCSSWPSSSSSRSGSTSSSTDTSSSSK